MGRGGGGGGEVAEYRVVWVMIDNRSDDIILYVVILMDKWKRGLSPQAFTLPLFCYNFLTELIICTKSYSMISIKQI